MYNPDLKIRSVQIYLLSFDRLGDVTRVLFKQFTLNKRKQIIHCPNGFLLVPPCVINENRHISLNAVK